MNYIGSKLRLCSFIKKVVYATVGEDLTQMVFCDLFAGTGIVGRSFKDEVKTLISNDLEYYSFVLNRNYIGNNKVIKQQVNLFEELNNLLPLDGFVYDHYCKGGPGDRLYFSDENARKIDAIRTHIEHLKAKHSLDEDSYFFLLASLLESADKVANTASVYSAYLKVLKKSAQKKMVLKPAVFSLNDKAAEVYNQDSNELIKSIKGDILYLDPPYNARQYGATYHVLNTIAKYDDFTPKGKTGLRKYNRSNYCKKNKVKREFDQLIKEANFKYIFLSYNNEGIMSVEDVEGIMSKYGEYSLASTNYQRFKSDNTESRNHKADKTEEYLHVLEKS